MLSGAQPAVLLIHSTVPGGAANAAPFLFFTAIAQVAGAINAVRRLEAKGGAVSTEGVASC